jgi:hypothetical protein
MRRAQQFGACALASNVSQLDALATRGEQQTTVDVVDGHQPFQFQVCEVFLEDVRQH